MSTWTSFAGGKEKVAPLRQELADQSVNLQPTESTTSADAASRLPEVEPGQPAVPAQRGWSSGMAPLPFQVKTTAAPTFSASPTRAAEASPMTAPPPATMTGRSASISSRAARWTASASGGGPPPGGGGPGGG